MTKQGREFVIQKLLFKKNIYSLMKIMNADLNDSNMSQIRHANSTLLKDI